MLNDIKTGLKERIWDGVEWINLAVDRVQMESSCKDGKHMFHKESIIFCLIAYYLASK
jgi:hypothetical protein